MAQVRIEYKACGAWERAVGACTEPGTVWSRGDVSVVICPTHFRGLFRRRIVLSELTEWENVPTFQVQ